MGEGTCLAQTGAGRDASIINGRGRQASQPQDEHYFLRSCHPGVRQGTNLIRVIAVRRVLWRE
jgi:hypothetical protein